MNSRAGGETVDVFKKFVRRTRFLEKKTGRMTTLWFSLWIKKQIPIPQGVSLMPKTEYFSKLNVHADVLSYRRN